MAHLFSLFRSRLSVRFVLLTVALLVTVQAAGFFVVRATIESHIRDGAANAIQVSERIWQSFLSQVRDRLQEGAEVLASDFGFRAAVASRDEKTIASALSNSAARIGASVAIFVDARWQLKGVSNPQGVSTDNIEALVESLSQSLNQPRQDGVLALFSGEPTQFVLAPVRAPRLVGYVLMGFTIKANRIEEASTLAGTDMALLAQSEQSPKRVLSNSDAIRQYFDSATPRTLVDQSQSDIVINQDVYLSHTNVTPVTGGVISTVFMKSLEEASARFTALSDQYLLISAVGGVIFTVVIIWLSRRVTYPLVALTNATSALEKGDFSVPVRGTDREDEIGVLARSFDGMRVSISDQQERITQLAYFDSLTALPNHLSFRSRVQQVIQSQEYVHVAIITVNLDRFKQINDVLGYEMGDNILTATAKRIAAVPSLAHDYIARVSGDEFAILVLPSDLQDMTVAQILHQTLNEPIEINDTHIDISASIGLASWPEGAKDCDNLINASQVAMYAAKARKEPIVAYRDELVTSTPENLGLLSELRRAVSNHELRVFLQPKVDTRFHTVVAAEALIRWQHPQNGMVAPYRFVPFAEQTGFVRELTKWILREVVSQWHSLQPEQGALRVSVNLSTRDLMTADLPDFLQSILTEYQVPATGLCLEITESAIMDDPKFAEQTLAKLSEMGFRLSIDDFGTGYSSLGYLKRLPVNELKVDQSFVFGMIENPNDQVIVRSTIDLAHNLGLDVVAEGVETADMYYILSELGCEEAQGYLIGKPMPLNEFSAWRTQWQDKQQHHAPNFD